MRAVVSLLVPTLLSVLAVGTASATTYVVRPDGAGDFPTIQAAIAAASNGDVIALADGTFQGDGNRDIDYLGRALTVRSQSGRRDLCTIDCQATAQSPHRGFYFHSGESLSSVLQGVTVTGGDPTVPEAWGGGILCEYASPSIVDCASIGNRAGWGAGMLFWGSNAEVTDCWIEANTATMNGGGIYCTVDSRAVFTRLTICGNMAPQGRGGGMVCNGTAPRVVECTFFGNQARAHGGGLWLLNGSAPVLENTIIAFGVEGEAILCWDSVAHLSCCDVFGNEGGDWIDCIEGQLGVDGNLAEDPLFCDPAAGDFTLHGGSPCGPSGDCGLIGAWPVSCDGTPVMRTSWGALKALYRE
jgi:hypothetical protein